MNGGENSMNEEQLSSGELRIKRTFLAYEKKRLAKLDESVDDITLINKIKGNIKLYEKQIEELEQ